MLLYHLLANMFNTKAFVCIGISLSYFFCYKVVFFFLPKQSQNLDPSDKTDLDVWDCLGRVKLLFTIIAKFHRTDSVIWSHSRQGKPHLINNPKNLDPSYKTDLDL